MLIAFSMSRGASIGFAILVAILLSAAFPVLFGAGDYSALSLTTRLQDPSSSHWFGTDMLGRDIYSRVLYGARISILVGFSVSLIACVIGTILGVIAGFSRIADGIIMRIMDGVMTIPSILLAIAFVAITRPSVYSVIAAISIVEIPRAARLLRSTVLSLRHEPYIEAAILAGATPLYILWNHILPNVVAPMIVHATYVCASAMVIESILSFVGAGVPPETPSWGAIMADGRTLWLIKPHLVFIPAAFLSVTILCVNLMGEGLREALDPRGRPLI